MPKNLELKIKLDSFTKPKALLESIGAEYRGELIQKDVYFKTSSGLLKLRVENGKGSLIKYLRDESGKERWSDYLVLKLENDFAVEFFKDIFDIEAVVEKNRLLYIYDDTRIHLDEVKDLGRFLELETLVRLPDGLNDAKERFQKITDLLEININEQIRKSYRNLVMEKNK